MVGKILKLYKIKELKFCDSSRKQNEIQKKKGIMRASRMRQKFQNIKDTDMILNLYRGKKPTRFPMCLSGTSLLIAIAGYQKAIEPKSSTIECFFSN